MAKKKDEKAPVEPETKSEPEVQEQTPDYGKQIGDLQSTISKQGETIEQLQEFVSGASVVINTIAGDETLKRGFQEAIGKQYGVQGQQQNQAPLQNQNYSAPQYQSPATNEEITELKTERRDAIVRGFEKDFGIESLKPEEQKEARAKIATYLGGFGWKVETMPVTYLRDSLEKAYYGSVGMDKLREEGKLEGIAQMRTNQIGAVGSMASQAPTTGGQEGKLTEGQRGWLDKLGVKDIEGAEKTYNQRDQEQEREKSKKE